ncbi:hypothetical protein LCGC14_0720680 [marine sediment metagenome]|jgi:hypothetical protein|uniref:YaaC-like Protein n=2 Tax=root TaxID=1 RepID=A0A831W2R4_9GAMM|nr:YaaC family protein [Marinobacter antarcticus]HEA53417.1 hypothetical protein [Marinobacter antarcticus]
MPNHRLKIAGKSVNLHGALVDPNFRAPRVLCNDPWDFVSLWLKREHKDEASFYWEQARYFYDATKSLPDMSSPLTSYYCFLNAAKALLTASGQNFKENHGVGGRTKGNRRALDNEVVDFQGGGILPALCKFLGEPDNAGKDFTLKDLFWQIPFIHRAFCLTYKGSTELFIPLVKTRFMRKDGSKEAWFQSEIDKRYISSHTKDNVRPGFELFENNGTYEIRRKRRFKWSGRDIEDSLRNFEIYHKQIRRRIVPIYASGNRWYLKKSVKGHDKIMNSQLVLIFAAMHRLSELSRYDPILFGGHFKVNHNWLLSEFIKSAPNQFVYGVASEITGLEFIKPDAF